MAATISAAVASRGTAAIARTSKATGSRNVAPLFEAHRVPRCYSSHAALSEGARHPDLRAFAKPPSAKDSEVDDLGLPQETPESLNSFVEEAVRENAQDSAPRSVEPVSADEAMAFSGPGPEIINGRLAMLGFTAALGAELSTHVPVSQQLSMAPVPIFMSFLLLSSASLIPLGTVGRKPVKFGPFNPTAELINGRAAMLGFAVLLGLEAAKGGSALF
mmetsp:Transcript_13940/g.35213  ORF Transcript_13940/g.35213 Transcript_13940/m.35213 type:complete len:218 (-) Transcript_13940:201-854(-)